VIDAKAFRMVEVLSEADLAAHPVWADFRESKDRDRVLAWQVAIARLDEEITRYDYCGRCPIFPVLEAESLAGLSNPIVALKVETAAGHSLRGYRIGAAGYGIFSGAREFCINESLPARARAELEKLATQLELASAAALLPMHLSPDERAQPLLPAAEWSDLHGEFRELP